MKSARFNSTAHNETCANIGNMLFNWRMLEITGDAKYAEIVETALYNSVLSGISLDGLKYFYTNPLRISADLPYTLRWPKEPHPVIITQSVNALPATIYLIAFAVPFFMAMPPFCKSAVHNNMHSIFTVSPVNYLSSSFSTLINAFCGISTFPTWRIRFLPSFCFSRSFFFREISPP